MPLTSHHKYTILPMGSYELQEKQQCTEYVCRVALARQLGAVLDTMAPDYICKTLGTAVLKDRIKYNILNLSDVAFRHFAKLAADSPKEAVRKILKSYRS